MQKLFKFFENLINVIMVVALSLMIILVFGNVVMRYVFNTGIASSEEMSRFLFVWLTFIGAIGALKESEHLGVDTLVKRLPERGKKLVLVISHLLMLFACGLVFQGSWKLTIINLHTKAPATGLPMSVIYMTGILMSFAMALLLLLNVYRVLFDKIKVENLISLKESEELVEFHQEPLRKEGKRA